jgi:hypothetical protein
LIAPQVVSLTGTAQLLIAIVEDHSAQRVAFDELLHELHFEDYRLFVNNLALDVALSSQITSGNGAGVVTA